MAFIETTSASDRNLLGQETVAMTVLAQDPSVVDASGPAVARIPVPADRLQREPRSHRFHVVDIAVGSNEAHDPVSLNEFDPWTYVDPWAGATGADLAELASTREFRAQNVFAVASHTLALFERHLGRPIPWQFGWPHLYLVPDAKLERNAAYSRDHAAVLFGWLPAVAGRPSVHTSLSYDVIAHEVSHAVLDGLRPRYTEPGLPDQLAFHEALADLVAMFSVFDLDGVALHLLDPNTTGRVNFESDAAAEVEFTLEAQAVARKRGRSEHLKASPLSGLAEQLGRRRPNGSAAQAGTPGLVYPALRRSVELEPRLGLLDEPEYMEPHRRAEVLVAAFMHTFVSIWVDRLEPLRNDGGIDAERVAEEGVKSAKHLLGMLLRSLDYLPPVELEFADVIDSVLTADKRLAPNDDRGYRMALELSFAAFGIVPPARHIVDEDGRAAPTGPGPGLSGAPEEGGVVGYPADPDAQTEDQDWETGLRYEHLNLVALRSSTEEVFRFIWNNPSLLGIDVRFSTRVDRVLSSTRVGPDGLIVNEIVADYTQTLETTGSNLPPGMSVPDGLAPGETVTLWGGGVLVFDQFGRFRLHQRKPMLDVDRQQRRLDRLVPVGRVSEALSGHAPVGRNVTEEAPVQEAPSLSCPHSRRVCATPSLRDKEWR